MDIPVGQGLILAEIKKATLCVAFFLSEIDTRFRAALSYKSLMSCPHSGDGGQGMGVEVKVRGPGSKS